MVARGSGRRSSCYRPRRSTTTCSTCTTRSCSSQGEQDYFREAGIGDLKSYFLAARRASRTTDTAPGQVLFNLLEEFVVRNTRPYIQAAYPNATIKGEQVKFPDRKLRTIEYSLSKVWGVRSYISTSSIRSMRCRWRRMRLETYRKPEFRDDKTTFEVGREEGLVGIFKTRFLKRLESSVEAFRKSVHRAIVFEKVYMEFLLNKQVIASADFWKMVQISQADVDDEGAPGRSGGRTDGRRGRSGVPEGLEAGCDKRVRRQKAVHGRRARSVNLGRPAREDRSLGEEGRQAPAPPQGSAGWGLEGEEGPHLYQLQRHGKVSGRWAEGRGVADRGREPARSAYRQSQSPQRENWNRHGVRPAGDGGRGEIHRP